MPSAKNRATKVTRATERHTTAGYSASDKVRNTHKGAPVPLSEFFEEASAEEKLAQQLQAIEEQKARLRRGSIIMSKRVERFIDEVPMNKGMNWHEYSERCYERMGRNKVFHCSCGADDFGKTGLCRICGGHVQVDPVVAERTLGSKDRKLKRGALDVTKNYCWSDDLSALCAPLLVQNPTLNWSQTQYVLRAVRQRLETQDWEWKDKIRPLRSAVDAGNYDLVYVMLEGGMDPNEADARGVTPLHTAAYLAREDITSLLIQGRANVNALDCHGQTPLFFAANVGICNRLLEANADTSVVNLKGQTALHLAAIGGVINVYDLLLQRSSNLKEIKDEARNTARYYLATCSASAKLELSRSQSARRWRSRDPSISYKEPTRASARATRTSRTVGPGGRVTERPSQLNLSTGLAQMPPRHYTVLTPQSRDAQGKEEGTEDNEEGSSKQMNTETATTEGRSNAKRMSVETANVKAIEIRGNISVDVSTGLVEILKPIEFAEVGEEEEEIELGFADEELVGAILNDIVEVADIFKVQIEVQSHLPGDSDEEAQEQAVARSELIKDRLVPLGVDAARIVTTGFPGDTGRNKECIVVKLELLPNDAF